MSNIIIWQTEKDASSDFVQLVFNDKIGKYGIITTDCGRPQVISFDEQEAGKLLHHLTAFLFSKREQELIEEYEKSEKDAMWERD